MRIHSIVPAIALAFVLAGCEPVRDLALETDAAIAANELDKAEELLKARIAKAQPKDRPQLMQQLLTLYAKAGQADKARQYISVNERMLSTNAKFVTYGLMAVELERKDPEQAAEDFHHAASAGLELLQQNDASVCQGVGQIIMGGTRAAMRVDRDTQDQAAELKRWFRVADEYAAMPACQDEPLAKKIGAWSSAMKALLARAGA